jgi:hypothetical protein
VRKYLIPCLAVITLLAIALPSCTPEEPPQTEAPPRTTENSIITSNKAVPQPGDNVQQALGLMVLMSLDDLITESSLILLGRVTEIKPFYWGYFIGRQSVLCDVVIQPQRVLYGDAGGSITVRTMGGRIGTTVQIVEDQPEFTLGEEVLVFLHQGEDSFTVTGAMQGKWNVEGGQVSGSPGQADITAIENRIQALHAVAVAAAVKVTPPTGSYIYNSHDASSEILLLSVEVNSAASDRQFYSWWTTNHTVERGETLLVVAGSIQNRHQTNKNIAMYAQGYDENGKQVSWTLDAAHIAGQIGLYLENGETGTFTLHLSMADSVTTIRIYANNYSAQPP